MKIYYKPLFQCDLLEYATSQSVPSALMEISFLYSYQALVKQQQSSWNIFRVNTQFSSEN